MVYIGRTTYSRYKRHKSVKKIDVFIGNFGSGKTELAINTALSAVTSGKRTALVDIDIVNPYFRSCTQRTLLENAGIVLITTKFAGKGAEVPSLPADIVRIFSDDFDKVIIDVGGDPAGAKVLGRYKREFDQMRSEISFHMVVNAMRPQTGTAAEIIDMCKRIEVTSRLTIDDLINNTNLAEDTKTEILITGQKVIEEAAKILKVPVSCITGKSEVIEALDLINFHKDKLKKIDIFMRPLWLQTNKITSEEASKTWIE